MRHQSLPLPHGTRRSRVQMRRIASHLFWILALLVLWQVLVGLGVAPAFIVSTPLRLTGTLTTLLSSADTWQAVRVTLTELMIGLVAGAIIGTILGTLFARVPLLDAVFKPITLAFYTLPRIALLPLFVAWFGLGMGSKIAVVFIHATVLFLLGAHAAVSNINQKHVNAVTLFGANAIQRLRLVYLPSSLPYLVTSARQALGLATGSLIVAETSASLAGMGFQIGLNVARFDMTGVLAWVILASLLVLALDGLGLLLQRRVARWSPAPVAQ
jgi:NitT/TauT family transport system permease protein